MSAADDPTPGADPSPEQSEDIEVEQSEEERATLRALRQRKVADLRESGTDPYPHRFDRDRTIGELRAEFDDLEAGAGEPRRTVDAQT